MPLNTSLQIYEKSLKVKAEFLISVENIVAKEEIAPHEQFLYFGQCFQNISSAKKG